MNTKKTILIVCNDNTLYSKLAEAYLKHYAGHWKNIFSAGLNIKDKLASPYLKGLLEPDQLESTVDLTLRSIEGYDVSSFDYLIALTEHAFEHFKSSFPEKEVVLLSIHPPKGLSTEALKEMNEEVKLELLKFVKNGPIKRWSSLN